MRNLTWGLVIATKDRLDPLKICVELALSQTRPPIEVVVADSSADWQAHEAEIRTIVERHRDRLPDLRLVYEPGVAPSLTMQRNQAVGRASADIVFMIDDDSFLYPDCAAEIMKVYEADPEGAVVGVQTTEAAQRPDMQTTDTRKPEMDAGPLLERGGPARWFLRHVLLMGVDQAFYPYDGQYPDRPLPAAVAALEVTPARLFGGCRMTFRRAVVLQEPFEPALRYYCPAEDLDGSYRISRHGALVTARKGLMHHFTSAAGRLNRAQVVTLLHLNNAVFLRKNIPDQRQARRVYRRRMARRLLAEGLKDLISRELAFPRTRGVLRAWRGSRAIFAMDIATLDQRYPEIQERIVKG